MRLYDAGRRQFFDVADEQVCAEGPRRLDAARDPLGRSVMLLAVGRYRDALAAWLDALGELDGDPFASNVVRRIHASAFPEVQKVCEWLVAQSTMIPEMAVEALGWDHEVILDIEEMVFERQEYLSGHPDAAIPASALSRQQLRAAVRAAAKAVA